MTQAKDVKRKTKKQKLSTGILASALWFDQSEARRRRLTRLGFTQQSWDNVCQEPVSDDEDDIYVSGEWCPMRFGVMTGDRAMESPTIE